MTRPPSVGIEKVMGPVEPQRRALVEALSPVGGDWLDRLVERIAAGSAVDRDEVVQRTRLAAWRWFGAAGAPRRWLARVARSQAALELRAADRRREHETRAAEARPEYDAPASSASEALELRRVVLDAIERLRPELREVIVLRHLEDLSVDEVAARVGAPRETVRSRLARARERLRRDLRERAAVTPWIAPLLLPRLEPAAAASGQILSLNLALAMKISHLAPATLVLLAALTAAVLLRAEPELPAVEPPGDAAGLSMAERARVDDGPAAVEPRTEARSAGAPVAAPDPAVSARAPGPLLLRGEVVDLEGRPVRGATVHAVGAPERAVRSDADGAFQWRLDRDARLTADLEGHVAVLQANAFAGAQEDGLLLVLAPAIHLAGTTVDASGARLAEVALRVQLASTWSSGLGRSLVGGSEFHLRARSDAEGRYELGPLPAVPGTLLWGDPPGLDTGLFRVPMETRRDLVLTFKDDDLSAYRRVRVVLTSDGVTPRSEAQIHLGDWSETADGDGVVLVPATIAEDCRAFVVTARGHAPWRVAAAFDGGRAAPAEPCATVLSEAGASAWPDEVILELPDQPLAMIRGRVVSPGGAPREDVHVWLRNPTEGADPWDTVEQHVSELRVETDPSGRFELGVLPGRPYTVAARDLESLRSTAAFDVVGGGAELELVLGDGGATTTLRGRCVAPDGTPLPGVTVEPTYAAGHLEWRMAPPDAKGVSGPDGRFVLKRIPLDCDGFRCEGRGVMPSELAVVPRADEEVRLVVPRRVEVRFDATAIDDEYWTASLFSEEGARQELLTFKWLPSLGVEGTNGTSWAEFEGGSSPVFVVGEGRFVARLERDAGDVVAEVEVALVPGGEGPVQIVFRP